jgi:hypothetical protein
MQYWVLIKNKLRKYKNLQCQVQIIIIAYDIANIGIIRTGTHHYPSDQGISLSHGLLNNFFGYIGRSLMRWRRLWQRFVLKKYGEKNAKWLNLELTHCNLREKNIYVPTSFKDIFLDSIITGGLGGAKPRIKLPKKPQVRFLLVSQSFRLGVCSTSNSFGGGSQQQLLGLGLDPT